LAKNFGGAVSSFDTPGLGYTASEDEEIEEDEVHFFPSEDVLHIEWDDVQLGRKVKGVGFTPKFSETPGKAWRGSVSLGHDNDLVYGHYLGLRPDELQELRETGTI